MVNMIRLLIRASYVGVGVAGAIVAVEGFGYDVSPFFTNILAFPSIKLGGLILSLKGLAGIGAIYIAIEYFKTKVL